MAKYVPIEMVKSYSGKICEHSDVYFAKKGNTLYTGKICNPRAEDRLCYCVQEPEQVRHAARIHVRTGVCKAWRLMRRFATQPKP